MPLTPHGARTFLNALSDFWSNVVKDRRFLEAYADAMSLNAAQLYQKLLEATLGTSLADIPLYDRVFFKGVTFREDQVTYLEGETPDDDLFGIPIDPTFAQAEYITNRILAPTAFLTGQKDFLVKNGSIWFRRTPFRTEDRASWSYFPEQQVQVVAPLTWTDPLGRGWPGVQPGDYVRIVVGGAGGDTRTTGDKDSTLYLDSALPHASDPVSHRGASLRVLRTPYDGQVVGRELSAHPTDVNRLTVESTDGTTIDTTTEIDLSGEAAYTGSWLADTAYSAGALVDSEGALKRAKTTHTSGSSFDPSLWDDLGVGYIYIQVPGAPRYDGIYRATTPTTLGRLNLTIPGQFSGALRVKLFLVAFSSSVEGDRPFLSLPHTYVTPTTLQITARRVVSHTKEDLDGTLRTYPAGGNVIEGVDYAIAWDTGTVTPTTPWDPLYTARASYSWRLLVLSRDYAWRGNYANAVDYKIGDLVLRSGKVLIVRVDHTSDDTVDSDRYLAFNEPATLDAARSVREIQGWATDALIDNDRLYRTFGCLLDNPRKTSEIYRVFLQAIARLFLLGPTFDRFESVLNAIAGLPLIRDSEELLVAYQEGVAATGSDGTLYGLAQAHDGVLLNGSSRFSSSRSAFLSSDVGGTLRVVRNGRVESYTIASYINSSTVGVSPTPVDGANLEWSFQHHLFSNRLRLSGAGYRFTDSDIGAYIQLQSPTHAHNRGVFRIVEIEDPLTVLLETEFGFMDESSTTWKLSRSGVQIVQTNRRLYEVPIGVPVRADIKDPTSANSLIFKSFEALTDAFTVVDYLEDPTWWHHVTIPESLMPGNGSRRTVTPELIEHVYGAIDGARQGDEGLYYGADDDGVLSARRLGQAIWYGGNRLSLAFPADVSGARTRDVNQYIAIRTEGFRGYFKILAVESDGVTLKLDRFPPPEAEGSVPPTILEAELPPITYRRSVAFIMMDRYLKYHSLQVRVDPSVGLSTDLIEDTLRVVRTAKPSQTFLFFETLTSFTDVVPLVETIQLGLDYHLNDQVRLPNAQATFSESSLLRYGDCYRFVDRNTSFTPTPALEQTLPTVLPSGTAPVRTLVKVAFHASARVGVRRPIENVDYKVDYVAGTLTVQPGVTLTPSPVTVYYVDCIRRILAPSDPHDPGETAIVYGGTDPTFVRAQDQPAEVTGLVDRSVQLTLGT